MCLKETYKRKKDNTDASSSDSRVGAPSACRSKATKSSPKSWATLDNSSELESLQVRNFVIVVLAQGISTLGLKFYKSPPRSMKSTLSDDSDPHFGLMRNCDPLAAYLSIPISWLCVPGCRDQVRRGDRQSSLVSLRDLGGRRRAVHTNQRNSGACLALMLHTFTNGGQ
jgi:hypothetical protein